MSRKQKRPRSTPTIRKLRDALTELAADPDSMPTCGQVLRRLSPKFRTLGRSLAWLAAYDEQPETRERASALLVGAHQEPGVPGRIREKVIKQAAELAEQVVRDPGLADERKLTLTAILALSGRELGAEELATCFVDFSKALEQVAREAASAMLDTAEQVEGSLQAAGLVDGQGQSAIGQEQVGRALSVAALAAQSNGRVGATFLAVTAAVGFELGYPETDELCLALEASAKADPERALALLTELATWPNAGALGAKARELSMRLRAEGVDPRPLPAPVFSHGLVSTVDGSGSRALQLYYRQGEGTLDAVSFVLNDRVGLMDVWCAFGNGYEVERQFREAGLDLASCDEAFARELIADALATSESSGRRVPGRWLLYRSFLGDAPLEPARRTPNLGAYMLETVVRSPALAKDSEALLDSIAYRQLGFDSDAAYDFVRKKTQGRPRALQVRPPLVTEFLKVVEPHERERLTRRLAVNLEHEARAGRAKVRIHRLAARTWIALSEDLQPFHELPYTRTLAIRSLRAIEHNVSRGYRTQDEANQASLVSELGLQDMLFEFAQFAGL
ncbi:MAG: hypothetical protein D6731_09930 [Planctomycetota bacterium]|nr:MAG: hypothetical protein D6731_09930 [Planctomycetota bacterium]